ncbi:hypothetical protein F183_A15660 [Bryobacterales bacterium F-183]|nr:hypothetical protein F183_A15660 [Bryobacterales bacterium F-183]
MANDDYLKDRPVKEVAAWYLRLADFWDKNAGVTPSLAAMFLRKWVQNRKDGPIEFDAPDHLKDNYSVTDVLLVHREIFLTNQKTKAGSWGGILPRIQGAKGFTKWDMKSNLSLTYESLSDIAPDIVAIAKVQKFGSNADRDIFGSLRGYQLKSTVEVAIVPPVAPKQGVTFVSWYASGKDRYDWNYSEYLTVPNPDFRSKDPKAIRPQDEKIRVYHSNAQRLELAGEACPYDVVLKPWKVTNVKVSGPATIDTTRSL